MASQASAEQILRWALSGPAHLSAYLKSGKVHGQQGITSVELSRVSKILSKDLSEQKIYQLSSALALSDHPVDRSLACEFLHKGWPQNMREVLENAEKLADDPDWMVRESAAMLFARLLTKDFATFSRLFFYWANHGNPNLKRAIALAIKYDSKRKDSSALAFYLSTIESLLNENHAYVRKNLGSFAIGDGLLPRFPKQTLTALKRWSRSKDENVRWNIAMTFSAANARPFALKGIEILDHLASDERRFVWRSVCTAMSKLHKTEPKKVQSKAKKWIKNKKKRQTGEALLKILAQQ